MSPLVVLGRVAVPSEILALVPDVMGSWPREKREVWEVRPPKPGSAQEPCPRYDLAPVAQEFLESTLRSFGFDTWSARAHSLVVFGEVVLHPDEGVKCQGKAGSIFHLVLQGSGTFHLPKVRDKSLRRLKLEKGLAFVFNPNVYHGVSDVEPGDIATLSAVVPRNFRLDAR